MPHRTVFFISDGTGITAETFGNAILAQFEMTPRHVRLPFIDSVDKAHQAVRQINHTAEVEGRRYDLKLWVPEVAAVAVAGGAPSSAPTRLREGARPG